MNLRNFVNNVLNRINLACLTYDESIKHVNPWHSAMTTAMKLATGQDVTMVEAGWSVVEIAPFGWLKNGKYLVPKVATQVGKKVAAKTSSIFSLITPKIAKQMDRRGWTKELIHQTVNNPFTTRTASNRATGNVATAYFQKNGSYVVKDNITNEVIQISNRLDSNWVPDATIINPYKPK